MYYDAKNKKWGTICDSSYSKSDWPSVLCKEMGYESCDVCTRIFSVQITMGFVFEFSDY